MGRVVFIVLDGVGVGALPDAAEYGDAGSNTLGNLSRVIELRLPFLQSLGLGNIAPILGVPPVPEPLALVGRLAPRSAGKDTTVGHWEYMGLVTERPFPTYPGGFPKDIIASFEERIGRPVLGNRPASGTAIIAELGELHLQTGRPIVYTSADSVFQVAAHTDAVSLEQLYAWCSTARELLQGPHAVARVIARPFAGHPGRFVRTADRRDFSLPPPGRLYLDDLAKIGVPVVALGKIAEIYANRGIQTSLKVARNDENLGLLLEVVEGRSTRASFDHGLLMTNLVDFDMAWGHRNDVEGFVRGLEAADAGLRAIAAALGPEDRLLVTADHGVDPTTPSTDHSREYVPLLVYPRPADTPRVLYEGGFADTGATVYAWLTGQEPQLGGDVVDRFAPSRGWRRYTPVQSPSAGTVAGMPGRVGDQEARTAGDWLRGRWGAAPAVAVVLGSGLDAEGIEQCGAVVEYDAVPHWRTSAVSGHPCTLCVVRSAGILVALLRGRIHEYEGYDLSEVQLIVRSLAAWGVGKAVLVSAGGAVAPALAPGTVVVAHTVLDCQFPDLDGRPVKLPGTSAGLLARAGRELVESGRAAIGIHASLPGPQYESPAELRALRAMEVATVSMSPAAELRAVHEEGLEAAVLAVVSNAGDTTHADVLAAGPRARAALGVVLEAFLRQWGTVG
jgi:phosphopentomutase